MSPEPRRSVLDCVRAACAWVVGRARSVRIDEAAIPAYAAGLSRAGEAPGDAAAAAGPAATAAAAGDPAAALPRADRETRAAFVICLDAINFGSGWWPTIRKRPGLSGYSTIAAGVTDRFRAAGGWTAAELVGVDAAAVAEVVGQDPEHPLMTQLAASLRDVGARVLAEHGGRFEAVADAGSGSAVALADLFAGWDAFADVSTYEGRPVPFFKRAQLAAADLDRAGVVSLRDLDRLTAFADNLVPHVLRVDRVLCLAPELLTTIEAEELLVHGSPEEVELRACAVHAVELLAAACAGPRPLSPAEIDAVLWNRGRRPRYKAVPRPRCRNTAY